jgi:ribosomal protein L11 methylase PrmA
MTSAALGPEGFGGALMVRLDEIESRLDEIEGAVQALNIFDPDQMAHFVFVEHGKIYLAGTDKTPTWTDEQKAEADLYVEIDFSAATVTVGTGTAPANTDTLEHYQIKRDGVQVQNSDIHESEASGQ